MMQIFYQGEQRMNFDFLKGSTLFILFNIENIKQRGTPTQKSTICIVRTFILLPCICFLKFKKQICHQ